MYSIFHLLWLIIAVLGLNIPPADITPQDIITNFFANLSILYFIYHILSHWDESLW